MKKHLVMKITQLNLHERKKTIILVLMSFLRQQFILLNFLIGADCFCEGATFSKNNFDES